MKNAQIYKCLFKKEKNIINNIIVIILSIMLCLSLQPTISNIILINTQINYAKYLKSIETKKNNEGFTSLYSINSDFIAWLKIEDVDLSVPIVQTKSQEEESFYLNHGFDKKDNSLGCPYQPHNYNLNNDNILFIGHSSYTMSALGNKTNVSLFGKLNSYLDGNKGFNYNLTLETKNEIANYEIVAFFNFKITNTSSLEYQEIYKYIFNVSNFNSQTELDNYKNCIEKYSHLNKDINATLEDKFLTLFTCHYNLNYRTIVIAQKV